MSPDLKYLWQQSVLDAFTATPQELAIKINFAERVVAGRLSDPALDENERAALKDALRSLRVLIREAESYARRNRPAEDQRKDVA